MRLSLVADDLTGAADAALPFAERGWDAIVQLEIAHPPCPVPDSVVAVATGTRHLPVDEARAAVGRVIGETRDAGFDTFYKKIDSTLRGNVGAEVESALCASGASIAVVCPAFPARGRTVRSGRVQVRGIALSKTASAQDHRNPVRDDRVATILAQQSSLRVIELCSPPGHLPAVGREPRIVVVDAESAEDLRAWVERFGVTPDVLWVGSAGLAGAIAEMVTANTPQREHYWSNPKSPARHPVLVVAGSLHPRTRDQLAAVRALPGTSSLTIDPSALTEERTGVIRVMEQIAAGLRRSETCILSVEEPASPYRECSPRNECHAERIARRLSEAVACALEEASVNAGLVLTGGDTARAVVEALGIQRLRIIGPAAPGIPIMKPLNGDHTVVTKAGGFGDPETLAVIVTMLRKGRWECNPR